MSGRGTVHDLRLLVATARSCGRARVVAIGVLLLLSGLTDGVGLLLLVPVLSSLGSDGNATLTLPGGASWTAPLGVLLALVVLLVVLRALLSRTTDVAATSLRLDITDRLRDDALTALLRARWSFFLSRRRSDLLQIVVTDVMRAGAAWDLLVSLATTTVLTLAAALVSVVLSPWLALLTFGVTALVAAASWPSIRLSHVRGREIVGLSRTYAATTTDALDSVRLVRAHDAADPWLDALRRDATAVRATMLQYTRRTATTRAVIAVGSAVGAAALVVLALGSGQPVAQVLVLVLVLARVMGGAGSLLRLAQQAAHSLPALGDVVGLTAQAYAARESAEAAGTPATVVRPRDASPARPPAVRLEDVRLAYPGTHDDALRGVTIDILPGAITAIAGPSGAGKSTLVDVVLGLLEPDVGRVLVDGEPLRRPELAAWRARLAYVPQDVALVPGSLRDNLRWSLPADAAIDDDACWAALEQAEAGFVRELPDGLDTPLGERGTRLSGGERQRVALARALLRRPQLLVLDEATSALDGITETAVQARLRALRGQCTVLLVAHRPSTVAVADHVVLLDDGRVAEQGGFRELLEGPGALSRLLLGGLPG